MGKISGVGKDFGEQCMESHGVRVTDGIYQGPVLCRAGTTLLASPYPVLPTILCCRSSVTPFYK